MWVALEGRGKQCEQGNNILFWRTDDHFISDNHRHHHLVDYCGIINDNRGKVRYYKGI